MLLFADDSFFMQKNASSALSTLVVSCEHVGWKLDSWLEVHSQLASACHLKLVFYLNQNIG